MSASNSFEAFTRAVRDSVESHAQRKGYRRTDDASGPNELADFMHSIQLSDKVTLGQAHAAAEVIYKAVEFLQDPRPVVLEKISGWAWIAWERTDK